MYRAMIVDDEKYIRKSIINRVNWKKYGIEVVGEAANGEEAYYAVPKLNPDLMLVDVRMPKLDGFELVNLLSEEYPGIRVIIISAYNDFEYAKQAIRFGVFDYLLKPLDEEELDKTLKRLLLQMDEEQEQQRIPMLNAEMLPNNLIDRKQYAAIACFTPNRPEINQFWHRCLSLVKEVEATQVYWMCEHQVVGCQILLVSSDELTEGSLYRIAKEIINKGKEPSSAETDTVYIGLSPICGSKHVDLDKVTSCVDKAVSSLKYKIFEPKQSIFPWKEKEERGQDALKSSEDLSILYNMILQSDYQKVENLLMQTIENFKWNKSKQIDELESLIEEVISVLRKVGRQANCYREFKVATHQLQKTDFLLYYNSTEEVDETLIRAIHTVFEEAKKLSGKDIIQNIKAFILANLSKNLQTSVLAQHFHMNSAYLSTMFKEKTKMTLSCYIEGVRMEKAKELLKNGACNVSDAAMAVGYLDSNYFCKAFKKYTGVIPSKYRIK